MDVCLRVLKGDYKRSFDSYSVRNSVLIIFQITFRDCRVHIFADNLSYSEIQYLLPAIQYNNKKLNRGQLLV